MKTSEKLNKLADFLENKVKDDNFNYATYGWRPRTEGQFATQAPPQHNCGTTGCAAGWAQECFQKTFWQSRFGWGGKQYWDFDEEEFVKFLGLDEEEKLVDGNRSG